MTDSLNEAYRRGYRDAARADVGTDDRLVICAPYHPDDEVGLLNAWLIGEAAYDRDAHAHAVRLGNISVPGDLVELVEGYGARA